MKHKHQAGLIATVLLQARMALILWATLLMAPRALAQAPAEDGVTTLRVSTQFVLLDASVVRKKTGDPIGNLELGDFLLEEDGVPQQLTYLSQDRLPLSIVFLFDFTESVRPVLKPLAAGARQMLDHLKPEDEVAILGFSSRTILLQDFTTDHALAAAGIGLAAVMQDNEATFIHQDMYEAIDQALKSRIPGSRRVMVWLTDGSTNLQNPGMQKSLGKHSASYLHTQQETTDKLVRSGVVTSALIERSISGDAILMASSILGAHMGDVDHYAQLTGGPVLHASNNEVANKLGELIDELRRRETLGYKPDTPRPPGTYCKLKLQLSPAFFARHPEIKPKDALIRTKSGYYR